MKWLLWIALAIVGAFVLLFIIGSLAGPPDEKSRNRSAIALCWEDQGKKSNDAGTAQFIAGACERMEAEYVKRWGSKP